MSADPVDTMVGVLAENIHEGFWVADAETRETLYLNQAAEALLGVTRELLSEDPQSWARWIHPADREVFAQVMDERHQDHSFRFRVQHPDLGPRWYEAEATFVEDDGGRVLLVGTTRDVTDRVRAQAELEEIRRRFETLVDHIDENYWIVDIPSLEMVYNSPGFEAVFGLPYEALESPEAWFNLVHEDDREEVQARMGAAFQRFEVDDVRYRVVHPDGTVRWVETILRPVRDAAGEVIQVAGVTRDITDQTRMQEAREAAVRHQAEAERLRQVDAFKNRFLNTAAHELSTPLTPVRFQLQGLASGLFGELSEEQAAAVEMLDRNFSRFGRLVSDLLDSTRLETGRLRMQLEETDLSALVAVIADEVAARAEKQGLRLLQEIEPGCRASVDAQRVVQVLTNLLDNAIKFTPEAGTITVRTHEVDGTIEIQVEDTGTGLEPRQLERVFQPFEQVHGGVVDGERGTGLGLYICKGIVEQQGGQITVDSPGRDRGCTVTVRLPALDAEPEDAAPEGPGRSSAEV